MMSVETIFLLILTGCILYFIYILKTRHTYPRELLKRVYSLPEMTISLEELAKHIWLKTEGQSHSASSNLSSTGHTEEKTDQIVLKEKIDTGDFEEDTNVQFVEDPVLRHIWEDYILPYRGEFEEQNSLELIKEGLNILHTHGDCPSLTGVSGNETPPDVETEDYSLYRDILAKITLKEHTVNVMKVMADLVKKNFQNHEKHIPRMMTAALYHDTGKIPEYWKIHGAKAHPLISANILASVADKTRNTPFWLDETIQIIREHHIPGEQNPFKKLLIQADKKARLIEISQKISGYEIKNFEDWFSIEELISDLAQVTNIDHYGPKWYAFSHQDVVYVKPDKILDLIEEQRKRKYVISPEFLTQKDRNSLIPKILSILQEKNMLAYFKTDTQLTRAPKFRIYLQDGRSYEISLIPLKMTIFSDEQISTIKKRLPASFFSAIAEVKFLSK